MSGPVDWVDNRGPAVRFRWLSAIAVVVLLAGLAAALAWDPSHSVFTASSFLFTATLLAVVWLAGLSEITTRVAVDGPTLRIRGPLGERRTLVNEVLAADLAPGTGRGISVLRLAHRRARTLVVILETPAAENVASRLERAGVLVNRRLPPRTGPFP